MYGGSDSVPIGANRVNRWFLENSNPAERENMRAAVDRENGLVMWSFSAPGSTVRDRLLIFNWQANRWAYGEVEIQCFAEYAAQGLNLDQLDTPLPGGIDMDSINVDSTAFSGGTIGVLAFDSANQGATFSGVNLSYCIDTKEFGGEDSFTFINAVRPLIEGSGNSNLRITPVTRNSLTDNPVAGTATAINSIGIAPLRVNARYHRYRATGTDDATHATGVEFTPRRRGRR